MRGDPHPVNPAVSVVVPVYCNEDTLETLQAQLAHVLDEVRVPFESVFVNDGCPRGSGRVLERLRARDTRVRVVSHERNRGQHRAVVTGLRAARGEWIVVMDGDLQDPPDAIPTMLAATRNGFAAVFAGRRGDYESRGRLFTSRLFKRLLSLLSGVPPDAGLFVVLSRVAAARVIRMARGRASVVALIGLTGLPLTSIPVTRRARAQGRSSYSALGRLRSGLCAVFWTLVWRIRRPIAA